MRKWLKEHRTQKGLTMKELSLDMAAKLSEILGITIAQIVDYETDCGERVAG